MKRGTMIAKAVGKELRHLEAKPKRSFQSRKEIPEVRQCDEVYQREWLESNQKGCSHE
jgi:flagellar biosynthesis chaperone FliJ